MNKKGTNLDIINKMQNLNMSVEEFIENCKLKIE